MKKLLIFLALIGLLYISYVSASDNCQIAIPRYGVIQCSDIGDEPKTVNLYDNDDVKEGDFTCITSCKLSNLPVDIDCGFGWVGYHWEITKNGVTQYIKKSTGGVTGSLPVEANRGDSVTIQGYCRSLVGTKKPTPVDSVQLSQRKWILQEGWGGSLPTSPIPGTEGCQLNKIADKYKDDSSITYLDPSTGKQDSKPESTYSFNSIPENWNVGDRYVFIKDWQTGIASISLTYDKNNDAFWCGGTQGTRKIYNVNEIPGKSGECYSIPTSIAQSNLECCFPSDCSWKGNEYTCNPDTWKCEETRWCDSQLDCEKVFGEGICENHKLIKWNCNFDKDWGEHSGTCEKAIRNVNQCPSDCSSEEYYNDEEGKCKPKTEYISCPAGKCCEGGGNYKPKSCSSGLTCCKSGGTLVGECKVSCEESKNKDDKDSLSGVTGNVVKKPNKGSPILAIIIGILVLIGVGGAVYYFKSNKQSEKLPQKNIKTNSDKFCDGCGSPLSKDDKFCIECGTKV